MTTVTDRTKAKSARLTAVKVGVVGQMQPTKIASSMRGYKARTVKSGMGLKVFLHSRLGDQAKLIKETRAGIPAKVVVDLTEALGVKRTELYDLTQLGRSTIEDKIAKGGKLSLRDGDVILRVTKVLARAVEVFEDEEPAKTWMTRPIRTLGGDTPLSLLDTETGYELVLDTLGRIEQGVVA